MRKPVGKSNRLALIATALFLSSCVTLEECGNVLGNKADPRIRSSSMRMLLDDPAAASARFAPYAAMAALVYEEDPRCKNQLEPIQFKEELLRLLERNSWTQYTDVPSMPPCDDDIGTFFRIWSKTGTDHTEMVLVFRGTKGGVQDWVTGNLRWITRFLPGEDQYDRSRKLADEAIKHIQKTIASSANAKPVHFYTAGHSLGGGLAQNVYYSLPETVRQVYAFDPSPVTGYKDNSDEKRREACNCDKKNLGFESKIYRIYETDEILSWLRFPLKLVVPIHRHIQEVRLNFGAGHSMSGLAKGMADAAEGREVSLRGDWWNGRPTSDGKSCTNAYRESLEKSCSKASDNQVCPD
jgi:hypothetical protein